MNSIDTSVQLSQTRSMILDDSLILVALAGELFYPMLHWKLNLPTDFRWVSHFAIMVLGIMGILRSVKLGAVKPILWGSIVVVLWGTIAILGSEQKITTVIWGGYLLFRYPLIGLYAFSRPRWDRRVPDLMMNLCAFLMVINVIIQLTQFLTGEIPADDLAGLFGINGVSPLSVFIIFVLCLEAGNWIVGGKGLRLLVLFGLSALSSALGEMKIFFLMAMWYSFITLVIFAARRRDIGRALVYGFGCLAGLFLFVLLYDELIPKTGQVSFMAYLDIKYLYEYLTMVLPAPGSNYYVVGRLADLQIAWRQMNREVLNLLLGFGMGSRSQSITLGASGSVLTSSDLGLYVGTGLATLLGEYGVVGITLLGVLLMSLFWKLLNVSVLSKEKQSFGIGLAIFTTCLPFWLFYQSYWNQLVSNLFYWIGAGYILSMKRDQAHIRTIEVEKLSGVM